MTNHTLADLEASLFAADRTDADVPHPDALARCRELAARYHALKRQQRPGSHPLRAYLLLDAWESNPLADAISEAWPEAATLRVAVPDDFYTGRENEAPCVVPLPDSALPDGATDTLEQELSRDALARLVMTASGQAHQRLVRQGLGAVLFSADSAAGLAQHLRMLGFQYPRGPERQSLSLPGPTRAAARVARTDRRAASHVARPGGGMVVVDAAMGAMGARGNGIDAGCRCVGSVMVRGRAV